MMMTIARAGSAGFPGGSRGRRGGHQQVEKDEVVGRVVEFWKSGFARFRKLDVITLPAQKLFEDVRMTDSSSMTWMRPCS
jgi:hypothetical protein